MKIVVLTVAIAALNWGSAAADSLLTIITPPEYSTVRSERVYVVGRSGFSSVEMFLNGESVGSVPVKDSMFHKLIEFGYGINDIAVVAHETTSRKGPSGRLVRVEVLFSPSDASRFDKIYEPLEFHGSKVERECRSCHNLDLLGGDTANTKPACASCHKSIAETFRNHAEIEVESCAVCHVKNGRMTSTKGRTDNLCFTCHSERQNLFSMEYIHGPVAGGSCICHNPHGSDYDKSLMRPVLLLCFSCHEDIETHMEKRVVHRPFERGDCVSCHDPHASNNKWALVKNSQELCLKCHDPKRGFDHNHPYNVRPRGRLKVPLQLTPRGQLECLSCHAPHSSEAEHLLRVTSDFTCAGCHEEKL